MCGHSLLGTRLERFDSSRPSLPTVGTLAGLWIFATLVDRSFVAFAVVLVVAFAILLGRWVAYELDRGHGSANELPYGA